MRPRQTSTASPSNSTYFTAPWLDLIPFLLFLLLRQLGLMEVLMHLPSGFHANRITNNIEDDRDEGLDQ
ncbi:hypothetical protein JCGZ_08586 [Jatropha curcas]|uniref:Uncharacterized protein n=1 Tax=Jatropha curcas TaxID=180498 RepID=A0A067KJN9_JATCU|nr:hypothetical protein JCGZ_08586 [Jatropha curcas]